MSEYSKQTFTPGEVLTAEKLNIVSENVDIINTAINDDNSGLEALSVLANGNASDIGDINSAINSETSGLEALNSRVEALEEDTSAKENPVFTGTLALNPKTGSTLGTNAVVLGNGGCEATGDNSIAQGYNSRAIAQKAAAFGWEAEAKEEGSFAAGRGAIASGKYSHAEGYLTEASGQGSHIEGQESKAKGDCSHAEGYKTIADSNYSHAEGNFSQAYGICSHAEGYNSIARGAYSHAEGTTSVSDSVLFNFIFLNSEYLEAEGDNPACYRVPVPTTEEGLNTLCAGVHPKVMNFDTLSFGSITINNMPSGGGAFFSDRACLAGFFGCSVSGGATIQSLTFTRSKPQSDYTMSFSDGGAGLKNALSNYSNEYFYIKASDFKTNYPYSLSCTNGQPSMALGGASHVQGMWNQANGICEFATGIGNYPLDDQLITVGNGTVANNTLTRSNAMALDMNGNLRINGDLYIGCNADSSGGIHITLEQLQKILNFIETLD